MENNENFVAEEVTENVEQPTEEVAEQPKMFTQDEVNEIVGKRVARKEARIRKEYDRKYGDLEGVLKAGMGKDDVGEITEVNCKIINDFLENDYLPIISPIGMDKEFNTYNINADDAACAVARAVKAEKLAFLTDIEGVYRDPKDPDTLISELTVSEARELIGTGNIGGGMLPKLSNCIDAIEHGVSRVHILDGRILHCLLLEFFTNKGIGTAILHESEQKYYKED